MKSLALLFGFIIVGSIAINSICNLNQCKYCKKNLSGNAHEVHNGWGESLDYYICDDCFAVVSSKGPSQERQTENQSEVLTTNSKN